MISDLENLVRLTKSQIKPASKVLARAFQNDPLSAYWIPDAQKREDLLTPIFEVVIRYGVSHGEVYATSIALEGVAVWHSPGKTKMSVWSTIRSGGFSLVPKVGIRVISRMQSYDKYALALHQRLADFPHWYLAPVGVDPVFQGNGYGDILMKSMLVRLDIDGLPCYLETHREKNVEMYKNYGFTVVETGVIPGTELKHWSMLRR